MAATGKPGFVLPVGLECAVTGGSGLVGQRLVEMLVERGAARVVSFDLAGRPRDASDDPRIEYVQGDITKYEDCVKAFKGCTAVWHIAAAVGPYHPPEVFEKVNYHGSLNVLEACKALGIKKLVMSSSPSTRYPYPDPNMHDCTEDDLERLNGGEFTKKFLSSYAEWKAAGEKAVREACDPPRIYTVAVSPHQVYGPRDYLFLDALMEAAGSGRLRVFGDATNKVSFTHVDNYSHGLILGGEALYDGSPALGKFYMITDGPAANFWETVDRVATGIGFDSVLARRPWIPEWFGMWLGWGAEKAGHVISLATGEPYHKVMRRVKLSQFSIKMLCINRSFSTANARRDLGYVPVLTFEEGMAQTIAWFRDVWLARSRFAGKVGKGKAANGTAGGAKAAGGTQVGWIAALVGVALLYWLFLAN
ncbi:sterol-4-alpha-carboxylate 3-dehydrogenase, decarboxylating [Hyaloraphidium curvatum]|nr:sterol-4-alpha-carboxylate 3-dehydrogenase, decarboxylating [Hyaloraphidium curvatum]